MAWREAVVLFCALLDYVGFGLSFLMLRGVQAGLGLASREPENTL